MLRPPADVDSYLPLPAAEFQILLALAGGERHGYGIMTEVAGRSRGRVTLGPGTLYGAIKRMLSTGLIVESDERPDPSMDDSRRRYYDLTPLGNQVARAEARRMAQLVALARQTRLLGRLETA